MISILRRVRGGGVVSVSRGRSLCPVSLGLEYDGSVAYRGGQRTFEQCSKKLHFSYGTASLSGDVIRQNNQPNKQTTEKRKIELLSILPHESLPGPETQSSNKHVVKAFCFSSVSQ